MIDHIDIVGNVKIFGPLRLKYYVAVLKSIVFLKDNCTIWLNIENGKSLVKPTEQLLSKLGFKNFKITAKQGNYGDIYMNMLNQGSSEYVLNLEDDHLMQLSSKEIFFDTINFAHKNNVDCIHGTFHQRLNKTYAKVPRQYEFEHAFGLRFNMEIFNMLNWNEETIYCGNNCIFKREYALKHWGYQYDSTKPHPFEERNFSEEKSLNIMILKTEFFRPIDDDHGTPNTCCLNSPDKARWNEIWPTVSTKTMWKWLAEHKLDEVARKTPIVRRKFN